jgi:RNA polymerase sigma-70 factor (ECF subfamily)
MRGTVVDRDLVVAARNGDREAFAILARAQGDRLFAIAMRILREVDLAEDAVQQALVEAWRDLPSLRDPDRFEGWLYRTLVHNCYAEAARRRRWSSRIQVLPVDGPAAPDDTLSVADRDQLERGFRRLPAEQRAVLVMHHYLGLSSAEIATSLDIAPGTVRSRLHYAHRGMRAALEADARPIRSTERPA